MSPPCTPTWRSPSAQRLWPAEQPWVGRSPTAGPRRSRAPARRRSATRPAPDHPDHAGGTLDHTYLGRFAPSVLAKAIAFRDGVCQAPGCTRPADLCDDDHRIPWPHGPTSGDNLWPLCRKHHQLKGHGTIVWQLPSGQRKPLERMAHSPPWGSISMLEHRLAKIILE